MPPSMLGKKSTVSAKNSRFIEFSLYGKLTGSAALTPIRLARREPAHNRLRFYAITVTRTLFDGWAMVREWGRIGQPGAVRETWFETESAAIETGVKVLEWKEKCGYRALAVPGMPGQCN
ncbi:MAG TPA: WGR domain-containing protein [Candidatus Competibacter sp.]|nr:WGR domain-containing protein [Candidatus Competibacter sp.]